MTGMYSIYFFNFGYGLDGFETVESALNHIKTACFEGGVYDQKKELIVTWSPITGTTRNKPVD